ncbi:Spo0B C-terminal domain-containing protein [Bacillus massilinigeriensis]|uniref:Spo0B C-terminal domain-containing protein n=1 Tax=Bacillus mediterraneensis TaxID=1805474 RepID=UPI0008F95E0C|nr:Spo0B C-terminal domain-containing protein [Bacillus mediterraneensis]
MKKEWDTIKVLQHVRHDWLNRLQLIKGNLSLNHVDRAKEIIDEIIVEARHEAKLTNLNLPQFASSLLTCNWDNHFFQLDYEIADLPHRGKIHDSLLAEWAEDLFSALDGSIEQFQDNHLSVLIEPLNDGIRFFFDFCGIIKDKSILKGFLENHAEPSLVLDAWNIHDTAVSIEIFSFYCRGRVK